MSFVQTIMRSKFFFYGVTTTLAACGGLSAALVGVNVTGLSGTLVLQNNGEDDLEITEDGSYTFSTQIANGQEYSVTISSFPSNQACTIENSSGTVSGIQISDIDIMCQSRTWIHPSSFFDAFADIFRDADDPSVAMDSSGNTIIAWEQEDFDGTNRIYIAEYRDGSWTFPSGVNDNISPAGDDAFNARVDMDDNGNAVVVWIQNDGSNDQIFRSEYRNGSWTHPSSVTDDHISFDGQDSFDAEVALDNNGNALIVWYQSDGSNNQVFRSEYRNGEWTDPTSLTDDHISIDGQDAFDPEPALSESGTALITWAQNDGSNDQVFRSEYRNGEWTDPTSLTDDHISPDGADAFDTELVMDSSGNALIAWVQNDGSNDQIFRSEYRNGEWTDPTSLTDDHISPDGEDAYNVEIAMDDNGNALIVWEQYDGDFDRVYISEYRNGSWTDPDSLSDAISPDGSDVSDEPEVAISDSGSAIVAWVQSLFESDAVYFSEYQNGSWNHPESGDIISVLSRNDRDADDIELDMSSNGEAVMAWEQDEPGDDYDLVFKSEFR